jgi:S1-C subfamily serine protease
MAERVTIFVRHGDPQSEQALRYLADHGVDPTIVDLDQDRQAGDKVLVGYDPVQLARLLPQPEAPEDRVSFGAAVRSVSAELATSCGLPATYGVEVGAVKADSPAAAAGIREGDIITDIGSFSLYGGAEQFRIAVSGRKPGDTMNLTLWRDRAAAPVEVHFPEPAVTPADS